jgi:hypothetical protein
MDLTSSEASNWLICINQDLLRIKKDGFLDKVYSNSDEENNYQSSFLLDTDPVQRVKHVQPHRHMLRLAVPRLEPMSTPYASSVAQKAAQDNLPLLQLASGSMARGRNRKSAEFLAHDKKMTQFGVDVRKTEDKDASQFDTTPMRAIRRKQAKKQIRTFFANLMVILLGVLFLGMLAAITIVITGSVAKIEAFVIFLLALSYVTSLQVKRIHRARKQAYLTAAQLLQVDKETPTLSKDEDMEHLELIKQDTSTYLHGLVAKDLERTF